MVADLIVLIEEHDSPLLRSRRECWSRQTEFSQQPRRYAITYRINGESSIKRYRCLNQTKTCAINECGKR